MRKGWDQPGEQIVDLNTDFCGPSCSASVMIPRIKAEADGLKTDHATPVACCLHASKTSSILRE